jgi:hypothetical protein
MSSIKIQNIEKQVKVLNQEDLAIFREWFWKYDSKVWERKIKKDVRTGKLEKFAREARAAYKTGKTTAHLYKWAEALFKKKVFSHLKEADVVRLVRESRSL